MAGSSLGSTQCMVVGMLQCMVVGMLVFVLMIVRMKWRFLQEMNQKLKFYKIACILTNRSISGVQELLVLEVLECILRILPSILLVRFFHFLYLYTKDW